MKTIRASHPLLGLICLSAALAQPSFASGEMKSKSKFHTRNRVLVGAAAVAAVAGLAITGAPHVPARHDFASPEGMSVRVEDRALDFGFTGRVSEAETYKVDVEHLQLKGPWDLERGDGAVRWIDRDGQGQGTWGAGVVPVLRPLLVVPVRPHAPNELVGTVNIEFSGLLPLPQNRSIGESFPADDWRLAKIKTVLGQIKSGSHELSLPYANSGDPLISAADVIVYDKATGTGAKLQSMVEAGPAPDQYWKAGDGDRHAPSTDPVSILGEL
jgi:hypothetical protein